VRSDASRFAGFGETRLHFFARGFAASVGRFLRNRRFCAFLDVRGCSGEEELRVSEKPAYTTSLDDLQWSAVLRSVSGLDTYRQRFHEMAPKRIVEFVVLDRTFPRSIQFCLINADNSLHEISGTAAGTHRNAAEERLGRLRAELAYATVDSIVDNGLHEFIDNLQTELNAVGGAIYETFIATPTSGADKTAREGEQSQSQSGGRMQQSQG
jgi:uncharacterized alpha-E superfamily protein